MLKEWNVIKGSASPMPKLPEGDALFTITLEALPSWNEVIEENNPYTRSKIIKRERIRGYEIALDVAKALGKITRLVRSAKARSLRDLMREQYTSPVTEKKIFCLVQIWRVEGVEDKTRSNRRRDVYNAAVKAFIDGFTDAGAWADDSEEYHTDFWVHYSGLAKQARAEISFYEV